MAAIPPYREPLRLGNFVEGERSTTQPLAAVAHRTLHTAQYNQVDPNAPTPLQFHGKEGTGDLMRLAYSGSKNRANSTSSDEIMREIQTAKLEFNFYNDTRSLSQTRMFILGSAVSRLEKLLAREWLPFTELTVKVETVYFLLGQAYTHQGKFDLAKHCFEKILEKQTDTNVSILAIERLGTLYFRVKNFEQAIQSYRRVERLKTVNIAVLLQICAELSMTYYLTGRLDHAKFYLARVSQIISYRDMARANHYVQVGDDLKAWFYRADVLNSEYLVNQWHTIERADSLSFREQAFQILKTFKANIKASTLAYS